MNIFGGIVNCATIANGIIAACKEIQLSLPLVVRLEGELGHAYTKLMYIIYNTDGRKHYEAAMTVHIIEPNSFLQKFHPYSG